MPYHIQNNPNCLNFCHVNVKDTAPKNSIKESNLQSGIDFIDKLHFLSEMKDEK